ncbi:GtrA family protein [Novosphingobium sp. FSY-8]|uniref:GtrA family protein n=1 Tax=Novosphingobium ovatum TaxID=1908523 RepID=A0ABW9XER3_9SPHN|nr:GtrA family protein [Novosphingobium ovatum]NBC37026.1 GtrA family protein [Novosphingobium ovatum]
MRALIDHPGLRYLGASVVALGADMGCFLGLLRLGLAAAGASALGYGVGIIVHWLVTSRAVYADQVAMQGAQRHRQKLLFVASALVGLGITTGMVGLAAMAGFDPRMAKLAAIGTSFVATWALRHHVVFRAPALS